ncbi:unnamed protein product [Oikopleura dioica]|uniref:Uncharacterized protein n=1 Tax=Oikopleura dioica TaxID=34765 RepID=E4X0V2_OIKDI|nr:unnamed protein product [Oikopleura dioica]
MWLPSQRKRRVLVWNLVYPRYGEF